MNRVFIKREGGFLIQLITLGLVLFCIHSYLNYHFASEILFYFPLWHIYVFHTITVFVIYTAINYTDAVAKKGVFNPFMLGILLKMVLALIFLLPWLLSNPQQQGYDLANFFITYFVFLTFEVSSVTKFLKNNSNVKHA